MLPAGTPFKQGKLVVSVLAMLCIQINTMPLVAHLHVRGDANEVVTTRSVYQHLPCQPEERRELPT